MPEGSKTGNQTKFMLNTKYICHSLMITNVSNLSDLLKHLFKITEKNCLCETESICSDAVGLFFPCGHSWVLLVGERDLSVLSK